MLDFTIEVGKFYKARDGQKIKIYSTDGGGDYKIHGAVLTSLGWIAQMWLETGEIKTNNSRDFDIVSEWFNSPEIPEGFWAMCPWKKKAFRSDRDGQWYFFNSVFDRDSDMVAIPEEYAPKFEGNHKDSLLVRPGHEEENDG